jgi:uncharacterized protein
MHIGRTQVDDEAVKTFCRLHRIRSLSLFGSVLRGEETPDSDLDLLIEFEQGAKVGLIRLSLIEAELSELLGRPVDLRSPADLSRYFRDQVVAEARTLYAA